MTAAVTRELRADEINWTLPAACVSPSGDLLTDALVEALSYRLIVQMSFDELRRLTLALDRERAQCAQLRDEHRAFRARVMREDGA